MAKKVLGTSSRMSRKKARGDSTKAGPPRAGAMKAQRVKPPAKGHNVLLRNVSTEVLELYRARAKLSGRSLQAELQEAIASHGDSVARAREAALRWQKNLAGREMPDIAQLIAEEREHDLRS